MTMTACYQTFNTPTGPFSVAMDQDQKILATAFGGVEVLRTRLGTMELCLAHARTTDAREQIEAYFSGGRKSFTLTLVPHGTAFQKQVWQILASIPFGETRSYAEVAAELKSAPRPVGSAAGRNPIALIIPCHRVIGSDGKLTGFAFGESIKRQLLEHESIHCEQPVSWHPSRHSAQSGKVFLRS